MLSALQTLGQWVTSPRGVCDQSSARIKFHFAALNKMLLATFPFPETVTAATPPQNIWLIGLRPVPHLMQQCFNLLQSQR